MNYPPFATVGVHTYHGPDLVLFRWGAEKISIGKFCSISQGVKIMAGGNHRTDCVSSYPFDTMLLKTANHPTRDRSYDKKNGDIVLKNDIWCGYGASIMGSCTIGNGAVIAANATVFSNVPDYAVFGGNPAKFLCWRFEEEWQRKALLTIAWWNWPEEKIRERVDDFYLPIGEFITKGNLYSWIDATPEDIARKAGLVHA